jgi:TolB-like protein/Tfp pilus assembly protein PilF
VAISEPAATRRDQVTAETPEGNEETSVAVLPFINMSDDEQNEYFSDGISEELLNVLVRIEGLRVPSRTSSFTFKGSNLRVSEIGRELGVDHVLEGSVRKAGNRIRVTAQLIDVKTDTHLWSDTYTRQLEDIFAVQDEIAHAIVDALKVTLSGDEEKMLDQKPTDDVEAYNLYLLGRHQWNLRIPGRMSEAIEPLEQAIALDPQFDEAWAALGDVYLLLPEYREGSVAEHIPKALEATERALAINPDSAQALTTSAYIKAMYQYQWAEAEREFLRAIELNPNYRTAYQWYAEMLAALRRPEDALAQLDKAAQVDPLAPIIPHIKGWVTLWDEQLEAAKNHFLDALRLDPGFPYAIGNLAQSHLRLGEYEQARARLQEVAEVLDVDIALDLLFVDAMENPELREKAIAAMASEPVPDQPFDTPAGHMLLGRSDLALERLLANFEAGGPYLPHINRMKIFDPLRDDPRFQEILKEMNLWP